MSREVLRHLKKLQKRAKPDPGFRRALKRHLVSQIPFAWTSLLKPLAVTAVVVLLLSSGSAVYAYQSDEITPRHPLYAVRMGAEQFEIAFNRSNPEYYLETKVKHLERRIAEVETMLRKDDRILQQDVARVTQGVVEAIDAVEGVQERERWDHQIQQTEVSFAQRIQKLPDSGTYRPMLVEHSKRIGRQIYQLTPERRASYLNAELRYEAELLGIDWTLTDRAVVVEDVEPEVVVRMQESGVMQEQEADVKAHSETIGRPPTQSSVGTQQDSQRSSTPVTEPAENVEWQQEELVPVQFGVAPTVVVTTSTEDSMDELDEQEVPDASATTTESASSTQVLEDEATLQRVRVFFGKVKQQTSD
ncbi:hypothetical protein GF380_06035 [Candidatus Uhrbacteria bacterium]|nr:hypothetical protein [Candidatus Uhrbacteria bacterium]MBD3284537.1 hypothetical protein [Candidatus Uhrbacteria bacterium]